MGEAARIFGRKYNNEFAEIIQSLVYYDLTKKHIFCKNVAIF